MGSSGIIYEKRWSDGTDCHHSNRYWDGRRPQSRNIPTFLSKAVIPPLYSYNKAKHLHLAFTAFHNLAPVCLFRPHYSKPTVSTANFSPFPSLAVSSLFLVCVPDTPSSQNAFLLLLYLFYFIAIFPKIVFLESPVDLGKGTLLDAPLALILL